MKLNPFFIQRHFAYTLLLFIGSLTISSCSLLKNLFHGQGIHYPVALKFIRAESPFLTNVKSVSLTVNDPLGKVMTPDGKRLKGRTILLDQGIASIGLCKSYTLKDGEEYEFTVIANAGGYSEAVKNIRITNRGNAFVAIYMVDIDDPIQGVSTVQGSISSFNGTSTTEAINIPTVNGVGSQAFTLSIPEGTMFYSTAPIVSKYKKPLPLQGEASIRIAYGDPSQPQTNLVFPGGNYITNAYDSLGKRIENPFYFYSAGWANIELFIGDQKANYFSKPIVLEMPINPDLLNPSTQRPFREGEFAPIWSMGNGSGAWRQEQSTTVISRNGHLFFSFPIQHFSTWNVDYKGSRCTGNLVIPYVNNGCTGTFYSELYAGSTTFSPTIAGETSSHSLTYVSGSGLGHQFTIMNAPNDLSNLSFRVFGTSTAPSPGILPVSDISIGTDCSADAPITLPSGGAATCGNYFLELLDGSGNATTFQNVAVWYKSIPSAYDPADDLSVSSWLYAGTCNANSILNTLQFAPGQNYRILIWWGFSETTPNVNSHTVRFTLPADLTSFTNNCMDPTLSVSNSETDPRSNDPAVQVDLQAKCFNNTCSNSGIGQPCSSPLFAVPVGQDRRVISVQISGIIFP